MPTSKSTGRSSRSKASTARKATSSRKRATDVEQLRRFLDPREVVVVTRARLQETRDDAGALLADLLQRGREDIEGLLDGAKSTTRGSAERVLREVDRARRAAG